VCSALCRVRQSYSAQCTTNTHTHTHTPHTHTHTHTHHTNKYWINMQPLDRTDSVNDVF